MLKYVNFIYFWKGTTFLLLARSSVYWQYFKLLNFFSSYKSLGKNTKEIVIVNTTRNTNFKSFITA
jgi:hypothetical protein